MTRDGRFSSSNTCCRSGVTWADAPDLRSDILTQRRLVRRTRSRLDRRAYALHLTQAGRRLGGKAHVLMDMCGSDLMAALPDATRTELADALRRLLLAVWLWPAGEAATTAGPVR
jgi:hypothetical protein